MDPANAAKELLEKVWSNRGFPVDPVTIALELGIKVLETELPGEISGALIKEKGEDPTIVVHKEDSDQRKRFTCAHELGHYIQKISGNADNEYEFIDFRDDNSSTGHDPDEIFSNQFAANLLMPEEQVRKLSKENMVNFVQAKKFGVSTTALNYRLQKLGLVKQTHLETV